MRPQMTACGCQTLTPARGHLWTHTRHIRARAPVHEHIFLVPNATRPTSKRKNFLETLFTCALIRGAESRGSSGARASRRRAAVFFHGGDARVRTDIRRRRVVLIGAVVGSSMLTVLAVMLMRPGGEDRLGMGGGTLDKQKHEEKTEEADAVTSHNARTSQILSCSRSSVITCVRISNSPRQSSPNRASGATNPQSP